MFNSRKNTYENASELADARLIYFEEDETYMIEKKHHDWTITMEEIIDPSSRKSFFSGPRIEATVFTVSFTNDSGLYFKVSRRKRNKFMDPITFAINNTKVVYLEIPEVDDNFLIEGNDSQIIRFIFSHPRIARGIEFLNDDKQPLQIKAPRGVLINELQAGMNSIMEYKQDGAIKKAERIAAIFNLYTDILNEMGSFISAEYKL